jgi:hypothetical protein
MGALTQSDKNDLKQAGFIQYEIKVFDAAVDVNGNTQDLNTKAENWKAMLRSRAKWVALLRGKGWAQWQIQLTIMKLYRGHRSERSPFTLLQSEVSPSSKNRRITDTAEFRRRLARTRVTKAFGHVYGKDFRSTPLPKHIPRPTELPKQTEKKPE